MTHNQIDVLIKSEQDWTTLCREKMPERTHLGEKKQTNLAKMWSREGLGHELRFKSDILELVSGFLLCVSNMASGLAQAILLIKIAPTDDFMILHMENSVSSRYSSKII